MCETQGYVFKPPNIQFTITYDKGKQQIFIFEKNICGIFDLKIESDD